MTPKRTAAQRTLRLKKVPTTVYLEPDQVKALKELSERTRVPQQVFIREGVNYVLGRYAPGTAVGHYLERRRLHRLTRGAK